ncbi:MAG: hypothetical protein GXP54_04120 [Deltaproteobacteria bacterium]|nr:hypothetical protein [Deltaproteobacteria bacterium]
MKVRSDGAGRVLGISKQLSDFDMGYIGMTLVNPSGLDAYHRSFQAARAAHGDSAVAEDVLQALADNHTPAVTCDLSGLSWLEVDTPDDLGDAEEFLMDNPDMLNRGF